MGTLADSERSRRERSRQHMCHGSHSGETAMHETESTTDGPVVPRYRSLYMSTARCSMNNATSSY